MFGHVLGHYHPELNWQIEGSDWLCVVFFA